jgi:hypothetical protein
MVVKNHRHGEEVACSSTLTLRLSTLFHFIVAEEHDKSVVPPYEEVVSSFAAMRVHTMPCLSALETASVCERTWSLR